jgi:hypothetical protein
VAKDAVANDAVANDVVADDDAAADGTAADGTAPDEVESGFEHPFISDSFLRTTMKELMAGYGVAFGERWRADPERLRAEAVELLTTYRLVAPVQGGVIVLPLTGRYRNVDAKVRRRREPAALFDVKEKKR